LRADVNLRLLQSSLTSLAATPYFSREVLRFSDYLCGVIEHALSRVPPTPDPTLRSLASFIWFAHQYLSGSISRESPYEIQFCLEAALKEWAKKECIITTALLDRPYDFHFLPADPWQDIRALFPNFDTANFDPVLVLMGLPRLYKHKPVFCIPLYHELGHFVDRHWGVTNFVLLRTLTGALGSPVRLTAKHWAEHFSDLFAACYVGFSSVDCLKMISPNDPASPTHPATADRFALVKAFLAGESDPRIEAIQSSLKVLGAPPLAIRFIQPNIDDSFDDLRPGRLNSISELHGLFESAWAYFLRVAGLPVAPWSGRPTKIDELERIVNDLTEKTIRNFAVQRMWTDANPNST
jgi:hypothetical protein